jgi:phenylalanine-4-hydroxylase
LGVFVVFRAPLNWWTVEYGLIGTVETLYGAGLLSSIGESCAIVDQVKENSYDISKAQQSFDITKLQPQLYVTPHLLI